MKLQNAIYPTDEQKIKLCEEIKLPIFFFHMCSSVIIRKDDVDYIVKDRWKNVYCSDETNIKNLNDKELYIISYSLLHRIRRHDLSENVIFVGDNIIIQI